jgi:hypothetical protein
MKSSQFDQSILFGTKKKWQYTAALCIIGVISGANLVRFVDLIENLSPGTHSSNVIGISSPILPENFLSCDRSNVFDGGRGIATLLNMLIVIC